MGKDDNTGTLNVTGEGQVKAKPDVARVNLAVLTEAKTAQDAVAENAARATQVVERMMAIGVPADGLRTVGLNVYPVLVHDATTNEDRIASYRAENTVAVETPVELAGKAFDEGIAAGANQGSSLSFGLRDESAHRARALEAAVKAGRAEAEVVTRAMGVALAGARSADIEYGGAPVIMRMSARGEAAATPVLPGDVTVTARVRLVYGYR